MSKFKVGDKVLFGNQVVEITQIFDSGKCMVSNGWLQNSAWIDDLELYKTPHERLLELGFSFWDNSNGLQYDRKEIGILIDKETKTYKIYWVVDDMAFSVDLELSKILTQYLEELEKENERI